MAYGQNSPSCDSLKCGYNTDVRLTIKVDLYNLSNHLNWIKNVVEIVYVIWYLFLV